MTNALPKLLGAVALVAVIGGGAALLIKGHKQEPLAPAAMLSPPAVANLTPPSVAAPEKSKFKRDMLDYEEPAQTQAATKMPTPAPTVIAPPPSHTSPPIVSAPPPAVRITLEEKNPSGQMKLESTQLTPGKKISMAYTCYQKNISPPLSWGGAPSGTKNFVVMMEGPDKGLGHPMQWGVYNIPASETSLPEALPKTATTDKGAQAETEVGAIGYAGPCIPKGEVTYTFSVFALDTDLKLRPGASRDELLKAINGHIIDMAKLSVLHYFRQ